MHIYSIFVKRRNQSLRLFKFCVSISALENYLYLICNDTHYFFTLNRIKNGKIYPFCTKMTHIIAKHFTFQKWRDGEDLSFFRVCWYSATCCYQLVFQFSTTGDLAWSAIPIMEPGRRIWAHNVFYYSDVFKIFVAITSLDVIMIDVITLS